MTSPSAIESQIAAMLAVISGSEASNDQSLGSIVVHAHKCKGQIIASKIETHQDLEITSHANVPLLQGYFIRLPDFDLADPVGLSAISHSVPAAAHASGVRNASDIGIKHY